MNPNTAPPFSVRDPRFTYVCGPCRFGHHEPCAGRLRGVIDGWEVNLTCTCNRCTTAPKAKPPVHMDAETAAEMVASGDDARVTEQEAADV